MVFSPHATANQHITYRVHRSIGEIGVRGIRLNDYFATHKAAPGHWIIDHISSGLSLIHTRTLTDAHTIITSVMPFVHQPLLDTISHEAARGIFPIKVALYFSAMMSADKVIPFSQWQEQFSSSSQSSAGFVRSWLLPLATFCSLLHGCPPATSEETHALPSHRFKSEHDDYVAAPAVGSSEVRGAQLYLSNGRGGPGRKW